MKVCPKCKQQYDDDNNFCENCENEDGSGVSLIEVKKCPNCGKYIRADAKRCNSCGVNTTAFTKDTSNLDIHGNAVRGDLNVTTNSVTNIYNKDESTITLKCHCCGSIIKKIDGYECSSCGEFTCEECYNKTSQICTTCFTKRKEQYKSKLIEVYADGIVTAQERSELNCLQQELGLSITEASELEKSFSNKNEQEDDLTTYEKLNLETAEKGILTYDDDSVYDTEAWSMIEKIVSNHPNFYKKNSKLSYLYFFYLVKEKADLFEKEIENINITTEPILLAKLQYELDKNNLNAIEKLLKTTKTFGNTVPFLCCEVLYNISMYESFKDFSFISEAEKKFKETINLKDEKALSLLDKSWLNLTLKVMNSSCQTNFNHYFSSNFLKDYNSDRFIHPIAVSIYSDGKSSLELELEIEKITPTGEIEKSIGDKYFWGISYYKWHNEESNETIERDINQALYWYKKAADKGFIDAQTTLGYMYLFGNDLCSQNFVEAFKWLQKAAEQGDSLAQSHLGDMYYEGKGVSQNYTEAARWCQRAADKGVCNAQFLLGNMYYEGKGISQNYTEAANWYLKAADDGNYAVAQFSIGYMYYNGLGVSQNYEEAAKWYQRAAEQGYTYAYPEVGHIYLEGIGVSQNFEEAAKWFQKALNDGNSNEKYDAQFTLGCIYFAGKGVSQNFEEAAKWFQKAADNGNSDAQTKLGDMYYEGKGIAQNFEEAFKWYQKAANNGNYNAQEQLGRMYFYGEYVSENIDEALKWYNEAIENLKKEASQPSLSSQKANELNHKLSNFEFNLKTLTEHKQKPSFFKCLL